MMKNGAVAEDVQDGASGTGLAAQRRVSNRFSAIRLAIRRGAAYTWATPGRPHS
jgi:hypothetical protein